MPAPAARVPRSRPRRAAFARAALLGLAAAFALLAPRPAAAIEVERVTSPGGIEAWLVSDDTVPVISVNVAFRGGAAFDPEGKPGLAHMVSGLLDEGAGDLDSQAFQQRLADLAISLSFDAGRDHFTGSLRTLRENRDAAFDLLRLAVTAPRFDAEPVARIRNQILAILARRAEDPDYIAGRAFHRAVFADHPYGRPVMGTPGSVKAIETADLETFVRTRLAKENLIVGVAGDITAAELAPLLDATFGALPETPETPPLAEAAPAAAGETIVVERDIPQSVVVFGEPGLKRKDPDYYAAYVMNYILGGGGFASRLNQEVRQKRGLAYSVYTYLDPMQRAAMIMGGVATENARVGESIDIIRREWRRLREEGVTADELANAKSHLTGSFPLKLDNTGKLAGRLVAVQIFDLGIDYLDRRNEIIESVTLEDVNRVAARLVDPDALTFVAVGRPQGVTATRKAPALPM